MSIRAMHWAWSIKLPPTAKLVLLSLADIADDSGACWPSHPTLAAKCTLTSRTVRRVLIQLRAQELVFVEPRFKSNGSRTSNRYRLPVDTPPDKLSGASAVHGRREVTGDQGTWTPAVGGPGPPCPGAPDTGVLVTTTEPSLEPSQPPPSESDRTLTPDLGGGGGDYIYPKNLNPKQREALRDRLAGLTQDKAQQVLDELAGRMAITQVKNPVRYCASLIARTQRGEFLPELALEVAGARRVKDARHTTLQQPEARPAIAASSASTNLPVQIRQAISRMRTKSRP